MTLLQVPISPLKFSTDPRPDRQRQDVLASLAEIKADLAEVRVLLEARPVPTFFRLVLASNVAMALVGVAFYVTEWLHG